MSALSSFARVCIRLILASEIVDIAIISFVSTGAIWTEHTRPACRGPRPRGPLIEPAQPLLKDGGMPVNLRMLRRIDQGKEVKAADGAVGGDRRGRLIFRHGGSFKAGPLALQQTLPQRGGSDFLLARPADLLLLGDATQERSVQASACIEVVWIDIYLRYSELSLIVRDSVGTDDNWSAIVCALQFQCDANGWIVWNIAC